MNGTDDFIGRLEDYLDDFDGPTPLPDHVRDAIHAELPSTRQVRAGAGPRRLLTMLSNTSSRARLGLAAAAIVVAVVVGGAFITNQNQPDVGGAPTPSPAPTVAPSASSAAGAVIGPLAYQPMASCGNEGAKECVAPGTYKLSSMADWPTTVSLDVPEGWWAWFPGNALRDYEGLLVDDGPIGTGGSGWGIMFLTVGEVSRDPCDPSASMFAPGDVDTPEELAAAMATWPGFEATTPEPTSIDGVDGLLVELTSTMTLEECPEDSVLWKTVAGQNVDTYPMVNSEDLRRPGQFRIIEVDGQLIVISTGDYPETSPYEEAQGVAPDPTRHAADQVELHAILDSIQFGDARQ